MLLTFENNWRTDGLMIPAEASASKPPGKGVARISEFSGNQLHLFPLGSPVSGAGVDHPFRPPVVLPECVGDHPAGRKPKPPVDQGRKVKLASPRP